MSIELGKLEKIDLREIWEGEATDFTPWLASEENISLLGNAIGIDLEVEAQEKRVGPFKADILCKDTSATENNFVLIENQLERTDHTHLGQLLTYAAGLHAVTIVWIADRFTDEHRAALDWLNEITDEDFRFFGLEIEAWRIGESKPAPKFNIISKPNDWSRDITRAAKGSDGELSDTKKLQLEYWTAFHAKLEGSNSTIKGTKPRPQHWNNFSIGRSEFGMHASVNTQSDQFIRVGISFKGPNALAHFKLLEYQKEEIEREIEQSLEWEELPGKKESRVAIRRTNVDPTDKNSWDDQHEWIRQNLEAFDAAFRQRIRSLNADDYNPDNPDVGETE